MEEPVQRRQVSPGGGSLRTRSSIERWLAVIWFVAVFFFFCDLSCFGLTSPRPSPCVALGLFSSVIAGCNLKLLVPLLKLLSFFYFFKLVPEFWEFLKVRLWSSVKQIGATNLSIAIPRGRCRATFPSLCPIQTRLCRCDHGKQDEHCKNCKTSCKVNVQTRSDTDASVALLSIVMEKKKIFWAELHDAALHIKLHPVGIFLRC